VKFGEGSRRFITLNVRLCVAAWCGASRGFVCIVWSVCGQDSVLLRDEDTVRDVAAVTDY